MKEINTSLFNKEKKGKLVFVEFEKRNNKKREFKNTKNILTVTLMVLIICLLSLISSIFNERIILRKQNSYKLVNSFSGNYAKISKNKRKELFKEIGFDFSEEKTKELKDVNYNVTYAYRKKYKDINEYDYIIVYYGKDNYVNYVELNLLYNSSNLDTNIASKDTNIILNNFVKINVSKEDIKKTIRKVSYDETKDPFDINTNKKDYYWVKIMVGK